MRQDKTFKALLSIFACLCFICIPAAAGSGITIDPVLDQIILTDELKVTGTAPAGEECIIETSLHKGYCSNADEEKIDPDYDKELKSKGIYPTCKAKEDSTWELNTGIAISTPGDYTFVVWIEGEEESRIVKNVRISFASAGVRVIEVYEPGADGPVFDTAPVDESIYYTQNTYTTPGSGMDLVFTPDISLTGGRISKGQSLAISGQAVAGKDLLVWIYRKSNTGYHVYSRTVAVGTDGKGIINTNGELLSEEETKELLSGKYFIFAISGTKDELSDTEDRIRLLGSAYLYAHEDENPFQSFVIILEEPWISFSGVGDRNLPDSASGSTVNLTGTTNLKAGSELVLTVKPSAVPNSDNFTTTVTGIPVNDGDPRNWSATYDTSSQGTGWFIVTISDPEGIAEASALINIYDPAYSTEDLDKDTLSVRSYSIDPETKDIITERPPSNNAGTVPTAVIIFETGLIFVIAACAVVIYKKR